MTNRELSGSRSCAGPWRRELLGISRMWDLVLPNARLAARLERAIPYCRGGEPGGIAW